MHYLRHGTLSCRFRFSCSLMLHLCTSTGWGYQLHYIIKPTTLLQTPHYIWYKVLYDEDHCFAVLRCAHNNRKLARHQFLESEEENKNRPPITFRGSSLRGPDCLVSWLYLFPHLLGDKLLSKFGFAIRRRLDGGNSSIAPCKKRKTQWAVGYVKIEQ